MSKKPRKKKAPKVTDNTLLMRKTFREYYAVYCPTVNRLSYMYDKNMNLLPVSKKINKLVTTHKDIWTITVCILSREKNGKSKITMVPIDSKEKCTHAEVNEVAIDHLIEMKDNFKYQDQLLTLGVITTARYREPSEKDAFELFNKLNVWKTHKAEWELK